jgi:hypothetical protein
VHCNHKFATTHLCDKTEVSDAEIKWKSKNNDGDAVKLPASMTERSFIALIRPKSPSAFLKIFISVVKTLLRATSLPAYFSMTSRTPEVVNLYFYRSS